LLHHAHAPVARLQFQNKGSLLHCCCCCGCCCGCCLLFVVLCILENCFNFFLIAAIGLNAKNQQQQ
jgi:hypothetical protein